MNIQVSPHHEKWIAEQIAAGRYSGPSQVVEAALNLLKQREQKLNDLRQAIQEGIDSPVAPWEGAEAIIRQAHAERDARRSSEDR